MPHSHTTEQALQTAAAGLFVQGFFSYSTGFSLASLLPGLVTVAGMPYFQGHEDSIPRISATISLAASHGVALAMCSALQIDMPKAVAFTSLAMAAVALFALCVIDECDTHRHGLQHGHE